MRILYVRNINQVAQTFATELTKHDHSVKLYEPNLAGDRAPLPVKLALMPGRVLSLRHLLGDLNESHFDIAHIHWASYGILGLMSNIPFIVECHGSDVRHRIHKPFFHSLLLSIFRRAAAVLCITPDLVSAVQSLRPDATFFPGPVDTERFAPAEETLPQSLNPWTVLLFTRLDPEKGPEIAVEGILRFARRHPGVRVQLLDWGLLREEYKERYGKRLEFLPLVPPDQVWQLITSADVVVGQFALGILSFCELQAMSCAKPVICSFRYAQAYPTLPPVMQAAHAEEVDEHLEDLYHSPGKGIALGKRAREWVLQHHDHRLLATRLESLYQSILS
jgi:glycosyltransferase involved in cell wall biosynthesis